MARRVAHIVLEALCLLVLLGTILFLIFYWKQIPDTIPTHFNGAGQIDGWGKKMSLLLPPVISLVMYVALSLANAVRLRYPGKRFSVPASKEWMAGTKLVVLATFAMITVYSALARPLPVWFLPVFLVLVFAPIAGMTVDAIRRR